MIVRCGCSKISLEERQQQQQSIDHFCDTFKNHKKYSITQNFSTYSFAIFICFVSPVIGNLLL